MTIGSVIALAPFKDGATFYAAGETFDAYDAAKAQVWNSEGKVAYQSGAPWAVGVTAIGTTTATITFMVGEPPRVNAKVVYGITTSPATNQAATPGSGTGLQTANLTGLTTNTLYYFRVAADVGATFTYSPLYSFRTL